jgi:RNA polymerase sigma factor (sigma-70 family)
MATKNNNLELTDQEIISRIKENSEALGIVYKNCKPGAIQFLRKINYQPNEKIDIEDIFQDAIIVLYEKIINKDFVLAPNTSLQTYLNQVCRNQLLNRIGKNITVELNENKGVDDDQDDLMKFNPFITDALEEFEDPKEKQFDAIEIALVKIKEAGGPCYELLTLFWYHKKSHNEIAKRLNYSNDKTSKKQKSGCQEKLRKLAYNELNQ